MTIAKGGACRCRISAVRGKVASDDRADKGTEARGLKERCLKMCPGICSGREMSGLGF